jgi:hypothetical protein
MKTHRPLPENNNPIAIWAAKNSVKLVKAFYPANFTNNITGKGILSFPLPGPTAPQIVTI